MPPPELLMVMLHHLAHSAGVADHVVLFVSLDRAQRRRAGERVTVVGQAAIEDVLLEVATDFRTHPDAAKWDVAPPKSLPHPPHPPAHPPTLHPNPLPP